MNVIIWNNHEDEITGDYESFVKISNVVAALFDISEPKTFYDVKYLIKKVIDYDFSIPIVLIGNKCDLEHKVSGKDKMELKKEYNIKYFDVSAKNGYNINEAFDGSINEAINNIFKEKKCNTKSY